MPMNSVGSRGTTLEAHDEWWAGAVRRAGEGGSGQQ